MKVNLEPLAVLAPPDVACAVENADVQGLALQVGVSQAPRVHVAWPEAVYPESQANVYLEPLAVLAPPETLLVVVKADAQGLASHVGLSQLPVVHVACPDAV